MMIGLIRTAGNPRRGAHKHVPRPKPDNTTYGFIRRAAAASVTTIATTMLLVGVAGQAAAQSAGAPVEGQARMPAAAKPMTPERIAWLKWRCAQLVAYYDYYGVSRGENSDGPRNHTRIAAAIECERTGYRTGIDGVAALLKRKAFDLPNPRTPVVEPEDIEGPDITNPTKSASLF